MTQKTYDRKILTYAKKYKFIQYLGGKCEICGEDRFFRLSFHHIDPDKKEYNVRCLFGKSLERLEKEIKKCKLLCLNCHHELHAKESGTIYKESKKIYLEYKKNQCCEKCGYNKCNESLTFHHIKNKLKKISSFRINNSLKMNKNVLDELDKCIVLCQNCHNEEHSDIKFQTEHYNEIIKKSSQLKKISSKIDRYEIKKLYNNGLTQKEISKLLNCSKGTISSIIKETDINKEYRINDNEVKKLYKMV